MKNTTPNNANKTNANNSEQLRALYDNAPYPEILAGQMTKSTPLLEHWINAAVAPEAPALHAKARILVAGCGSGAEVLVLARQFPEAQIVGVDFSAPSIVRAKELVEEKKLTNVRLEVADLTVDHWSKKYAAFDFISCHGVADFVSDASALMQTLAGCLTPSGVLCMTMNSPHHPGGRLREAFAALGISPADFQDSSDLRALLQLAVQLMGSNIGIEGIGTAPKAYLEVDIFPPIAHHDSIDTWCDRAQAAGLSFCGSMDALVGLTALSDEQLPLLYGLGAAALSVWMMRLRQPPGMQLLFSRRKPTEPCFDNLETIGTWQPRLAAFLGNLPLLTEDPSRSRPITLQFPELPDFVIHCTAYDLEVLRCCDGEHSISDIRKGIAVQGDSDALLACLFRAYHFGVLLG